MLPNVTHQKATEDGALNMPPRKKAAKASKKCSERMVRGHLRSHPPSKYNVGEKVYIRLPRKGGIKSAQKRHCVIEAVIIN